MDTISFVIPCYNSSSTIGYVFSEIVEKMQERPELDFEIICVIDGSPDNVFVVLSKIAQQDSHLKIINLSKNFGKANAEMAGYNAARGNIIVVLDDDGQCPINNLWDLIEPLYQEYDLSVARYYKKKQSIFKNIGSNCNNLMARLLIGLPRGFQFSNFYAFNRMICDEVASYKGPYPYFIGLALRVTNRIKNVDMEERARISGTTNFTFKKMLSLWLNGFTNFSIKPLRIADLLGALCALVGMCYGIYIIVYKLLFGGILAGYASLLAAILFIGGLIMILLGLVGEYIGRIFMINNHAPQYVIRQSINFKDDNHLSI